MPDDARKALQTVVAINPKLKEPRVWLALAKEQDGKQSEAAMRLFFCLRKLDAAGVDEIVAEPITDKGLGMAIMDRLRRAAGKR